MQTLVVYASVYGNTHAIARSIAEIIGKKGSVRVYELEPINAIGLYGIDLVEGIRGMQVFITVCLRQG